MISLSISLNVLKSTISYRTINVNVIPVHYSIYTVRALVLHCSGMINLHLEKFDAAKRHLQSSFGYFKNASEANDNDTMQAHLGIAQALRLAGNLQDAKEILEIAEGSLLGKNIYIYI